VKTSIEGVGVYIFELCPIYLEETVALFTEDTRHNW
jgi:hypothetical protein